MTEYWRAWFGLSYSCTDESDLSNLIIQAQRNQSTVFGGILLLGEIAQHPVVAVLKTETGRLISQQRMVEKIVPEMRQKPKRAILMVAPVGPLVSIRHLRSY